MHVDSGESGSARLLVGHHCVAHLRSRHATIGKSARKGTIEVGKMQSHPPSLSLSKAMACITPCEPIAAHEVAVCLDIISIEAELLPGSKCNREIPIEMIEL